MIRILSVDDHPALQAGLRTVLEGEPDLVPIGSASTVEELLPMLHETRPDVVLLDYHLPRGDGLVLCHRIKTSLTPPRVLVYSAYADTALTVPAVVAGADGIVHKGAPARELFAAIRAVVRGERVLPAISAELLATAAERLDQDDLPLVAMRVDGTPLVEIARVLCVEPAQVARRLERVITRLGVEVPVAG